MRIGYDAKRYFSNYTGLGNYSRTLVENMARFVPENQYVLFARNIEQNPRTFTAFEKDNISIIQPKPFQLLWRSIDVNLDLLKQNINLYHGLSAEIPLAITIPSVVTIHDLIFEIYPDQYKPIDRTIYSIKAKYACEKSDHIIAISQATKEDIMRLYRVPEERISVIYQPCDDQFYKEVTPDKINNLRDKYSLPDKYMLYVGSVIERKNLLSIVEAMNLLRVKGQDLPHLVVVGNTDNNYGKNVKESVQNQNLNDYVHFLEQVPFEDFPALYHEATLFLYPSEYEGFGIPVLEAQAVGVPVITSNKSSLPEVAGPHSICLQTINASTLSTAISELWSNEDKRKEMVKAGKEYIKKFDAKILSNQVMQLYQRFA